MGVGITGLRNGDKKEGFLLTTSVLRFQITRTHRRRISDMPFPHPNPIPLAAFHPRRCPHIPRGRPESRSGRAPLLLPVI